MRNVLANIPRWLLFPLIGLLGIMTAGFIGRQIVRAKNRRNPTPMAPRMAFFLDSGLRDCCFGTAEKVLEQAGITPGMRILEIGPGPGRFTVPMARRVAERGQNGSVTCIEIQSEMVDMLRKRLQMENIANVEIFQEDAQQLALPADSFDMVLLVNVIGEVPDAQVLFRECVRVLKPNGIVAVNEQVSDPDFLSPGAVRKLAISAGLQDDGCLGNPWWIYTARYRKPAGTLVGVSDS
jgi:SAM-dependent methyltransferase